MRWIDEARDAVHEGVGVHREPHVERAVIREARDRTRHEARGAPRRHALVAHAEGPVRAAPRDDRRREVEARGVVARPVGVARLVGLERALDVPPVPTGRDEREAGPVRHADVREDVHVAARGVRREREWPDHLAAPAHPLLRGLVEERRDLAREPCDQKKPHAVLRKAADLAAVVAPRVHDVPVPLVELHDLLHGVLRARGQARNVFVDHQERRVAPRREHQLRPDEHELVHLLILLGLGELVAEERRGPFAGRAPEHHVGPARAELTQPFHGELADVDHLARDAREALEVGRRARVEVERPDHPEAPLEPELRQRGRRLLEADRAAADAREREEDRVDVLLDPVTHSPALPLVPANRPTHGRAGVVEREPFGARVARERRPTRYEISRVLVH